MAYVWHGTKTINAPIYNHDKSSMTHDIRYAKTIYSLHKDTPLNLLWMTNRKFGVTKVLVYIVLTGWRHDIWTNARILLTGPLGTRFSEIWIEIHTFLFKKITFQNVVCEMADMLSRPQCVNTCHPISTGRALGTFMLICAHLGKRDI